jgi:predicted S18 family serine protease
MKELSNLMKDWLTPDNMTGLDELVKYLEELGDKAKNIKTVDDAYDFAKELGMKCTREEFKEGAENLKYIDEQIKKEKEKIKKKAENDFLDAVAAYKTAEDNLKKQEAIYAQHSKELEAEFQENRKQAPAYVEKMAKEMEEETQKFYDEVQKSFTLDEKDIKAYEEFTKNLEKLGKRIADAKTTKDYYEIAKDLGLKCTYEEFKDGVKDLGKYADMY